MKRIETIKRALLPILMFFSLYTILHIVLMDDINTSTEFEKIVTSLIAGFILSLVNLIIAAKRKHWGFRYEFLVFLVTYVIVQVISWILIRVYMLHDISHNSFLYKVIYYFPQTVIVLYTVPGAILYHVVGYIGYSWNSLSKNKKSRQKVMK